ncbi:MAG: MerR family transcriptional regulator [Candidatus Omnitrophica bacterium]|nr:MerR family transcriptional regulator [Candidatus Omnitrophota bacterium]
MEKRYLISEVIKILQIGRKTYYRWEKDKLIPPARRDKLSNYRYFTKKDIERLKKITGRG